MRGRRHRRRAYGPSVRPTAPSIGADGIRADGHRRGRRAGRGGGAGRGAGLARRTLGPGRRAQGLARTARRQRLGRPDVAGGLVRPGPQPLGGRGRRGGAGRTAGAGREPGQGEPVGEHGARPRERRAQVPLPAAPPARGRADVPALQRARRRLRPGVGADPGRAGRLGVGGERSEGVDLGRPPRPLRAAHRPHRLGRPQASGHQLLLPAHAAGGRGGPAAAPGHRRRPLQRGLPHRRPCAGRLPPGRGQRWLVGAADRAHVRARRHGRRPSPAPAPTDAPAERSASRRAAERSAESEAPAPTPDLSLVALARAVGRNGDAHVRQGIAHLHCLRTVNEWNGRRARAEMEQGSSSPVASLGKLAMSGIVHTAARLQATILGAEATLAGPGHEVAAECTYALLNAYFTSIGGGTDQIQRNIIGERILGLPREPEIDKALPFREVRKSPAAAPAEPAALHRGTPGRRGPFSGFQPGPTRMRHTPGLTSVSDPRGGRRALLRRRSAPGQSGFSLGKGHTHQAPRPTSEHLLSGGNHGTSRQDQEHDRRQQLTGEGRGRQGRVDRGRQDWRQVHRQDRHGRREGQRGDRQDRRERSPARPAGRLDGPTQPGPT